MKIKSYKSHSIFISENSHLYKTIDEYAFFVRTLKILYYIITDKHSLMRTKHPINLMSLKILVIKMTILQSQEK